MIKRIVTTALIAMALPYMGRAQEKSNPVPNQETSDVLCKKYIEDLKTINLDTKNNVNAADILIKNHQVLRIKLHKEPAGFGDLPLQNGNTVSDQIVSTYGQIQLSRKVLLEGKATTKTIWNAAEKTCTYSSEIDLYKKIATETIVFIIKEVDKIDRIIK